MNNVRIVIHQAPSVPGKPYDPPSWDLLYEDDSGQTVNAGNFATPDAASEKVYALQREAAEAAKAAAENG